MNANKVACFVGAAVVGVTLCVTAAVAQTTDLDWRFDTAGRSEIKPLCKETGLPGAVDMRWWTESSLMGIFRLGLILIVE